MSKKKSKNKKKNTKLNQPRRESGRPQTLRQAQSVQTRHTGAAAPGDVRLSQCMIVKNEEKNIEKALGWARDYAFEQIVVDTGSTDRTVELAEGLGAKVYHFEWINDFSAAKNFAMDQAKGNWIAILDADEYMPLNDVRELMGVLKRLQSDPVKAKQYDSILNSWVHLDDNDNVIAVLTNQRIFRNSPELRYAGKIHESVKIKHKYFDATNLRIMHTGYSMSTFTETDKRKRNIKMLRDELEHDPNNPEMMIYLADSIKSAGTEESRAEAEQLYLKALACDTQANLAIKRLAYDFLIRRFLEKKEKKEKTIKLCDDALADLPGNIDYRYYRAFLNNQLGNYKLARDDLDKCERAFTDSNTVPETRILLPCPIPLFVQSRISASGMGDEQAVVTNSTIIKAMLADGKNRPETAEVYIKAMLHGSVSSDDVLAELADIYDFDDPRELIIVARAAKDSGAIGLAQHIMEIASGVM